MLEPTIESALREAAKTFEDVELQRYVRAIDANQGGTLPREPCALKIMGGSAPGDYGYMREKYNPNEGIHPWNAAWLVEAVWERWEPCTRAISAQERQHLIYDAFKAELQRRDDEAPKEPHKDTLLAKMAGGVASLGLLLLAVLAVSSQL